MECRCRQAQSIFSNVLELWQRARVVGRGASAAKCAIVISVTELHNFVCVARTEVYLYKLSVLKLCCSLLYPRGESIFRNRVTSTRRFRDENPANKSPPRRWYIFPRLSRLSLSNEMSFVNSATDVAYPSYTNSKFSHGDVHETLFIRSSRRFDIESSWSRRWRGSYRVVASKFGSRRSYLDVSTTHDAKSGGTVSIFAHVGYSIPPCIAPPPWTRSATKSTHVAAWFIDFEAYSWNRSHLSKGIETRASRRQISSSLRFRY